MIIILSLTLEKKTSEHHIPIIPVDAEAVSVTSQTTERVRCTLDKCRDQNFLTDTFTVDHLLSKLSSSSIGVLACMSPIDGVGLPFFKKYLKKSQIKNKNFLCIPLSDGVHFQGYVADVCNKTIVHVDSLRNNNSKNATSKAIATTLFDDENINFKSYFKRRVQFDSNSCGVWLVAGIASYVHALPLPSGLDDAFDIAYSLLERKLEIPVNSSVPTSSNWKSEDHINFFSTAHFLVHALMKDPFRSEFYLEDAPKGIRSNFFYITDVTKCPMSTITADDNGAYIKTRNTTKLYCQVGDETKGVREESGKFYYNVKQSYNSYERKYVSSFAKAKLL